MSISRDRRAIVASGTRAIPIMPRWIDLKNADRELTRRLRWLSLRQASIGASDIAAIIGCEGAYSSRFALWWSKQEGAPLGESEMTEEQEWGLRLEDALAAKFAENHHGELYVFKAPAHMWRHPDYEWMTCTPDRLTLGDGDVLRPLELKTDQNGDRWDEFSYPQMYRVQLMWQSIVFGVTGGYLGALVHKRYKEYAEEFAADEITEMIDIGREFWESLKGAPPDVDGHDSTRVTLMRLHGDVDREAKAILPEAAVAEYVEAYELSRAAADRRKAAENRLRDLMGSSGTAVDQAGRKVASRLVFKVGESVRAAFVNDQIRRATGKEAR